MAVGRSVLAVAALAAIVAWPFVFGSPFDLRIFTQVGAFALLVIGYQFIFGHAGALSLAQATFFGLGAYTTASLALAGQPFAVTFPAAIVLPVGVAALIAIPVLRLSSHYFALATLGVSQIVTLLAIEWVSVTGGANGLAGVPLPRMFGAVIGRGWPLLALVWASVAISGLLAWQITRGLYGRACHVARDEELVARSLGIDVGRIRFAMLLLSAAYAGAAGAFFAHINRIASPEALEFKTMVVCLTMAVVGGRTRVAGAILGAFLVVQLPEWFRFLERSYVMLNGAVLIGLLILAPDGLVGLLDRLLPPRRRLDRRNLDAVRGQAGAAPPPGRALLPSATPILQVAGLTKRFGGVRALTGVNFDLHRGSITAVIGPNGSGKTTLVNCITGAEAPSAGTVRLGGADITAMPAHEIARRGIARTFQNLRLVESMSVLDNVAVARFGAERAGLARALGEARRDEGLLRASAYAEHLLARLGVEDTDRLCGTLPYGAKRRVEIARALALEPQLLLLDEPAAGLNESEQADLAGRLQELAVDGFTLLIVEHNMPFLRSLATAMICLDGGELIAQGRPAEIYGDPRVIEAYLGRDSAAVRDAAAPGRETADLAEASS